MQKGIYRGSKSHLSRLERQAIASRLGMFRNRKYGNWEYEGQSMMCRMQLHRYKHLIIKELQDYAKNRIFGTNNALTRKEVCSFNYSLLAIFNANELPRPWGGFWRKAQEAFTTGKRHTIRRLKWLPATHS